MCYKLQPILICACVRMCMYVYRQRDRIKYIVIDYLSAEILYNIITVITIKII